MDFDESQAMAVVAISADDGVQLRAALDFILSIDEKFNVQTASLGSCDADIVFLKRWLNVCLKENHKPSGSFISLEQLADAFHVAGGDA